MAPSNRPPRACSTPAVSAPASGWPPMKRSSPTAETTARLAEPTSVTTQSGPASASAARTAPGSAPTGAATNAASAPASASAGVAHETVTAPRAERGLAGARRGVEAPHLGAEALARGQPDRAADQPDAEDGDDHRRRRTSVRRAWTTAPCPPPRPRPPPSRRRRRTGRRTGPAVRRRSPARARVHLDDDAVGARRGRGQRERLDQRRARPAAWLGIDDHRQVRELLEHRHGGEVEREAGGGLEGADAALAEHHVRIALREDVLRRHQQLLERRARGRA